MWRLNHMHQPQGGAAPSCKRSGYSSRYFPSSSEIIANDDPFQLTHRGFLLITTPL
jgi:hypothetical protein